MEFLCRIDWVAVSAIVTFLMAIAAFWALYENRKQLNELKRQWQEERKAQLDFSIEIQRFASRCFKSQCSMFCLKMQNVGKTVAKIKKVDINKDFLEKMPQDYRVHIETAFSNPLRIAPSVTKHYWLCLANIDDVSKSEKDKYLSFISTPFRITSTFDDGSVQEFEFTISNYLYLGEAVTIETDIVKASKRIEEQLKKLVKE